MAQWMVTMTTTALPMVWIPDDDGDSIPDVDDSDPRSPLDTDKDGVPDTQTPSR